MRRKAFTSLSLTHAATPERFASVRAWMARLSHERRPGEATGAPIVSARCNAWLVFALAVSAGPGCQRPAHAEEAASLREQGNTAASESPQGSTRNRGDRDGPVAGQIVTDEPLDGALADDRARDVDLADERSASSDALIDDGYPRAAAFDEDDDDDLEDDEDAGVADEDAGLLVADSGAAPVDEEDEGDAGTSEDTDAGAEEYEQEAGATEPPLTRTDLFLSADPNQSRAPLELSVTETVRAALSADEELSSQARTTLYVTTQNEVVVLQGEVPSERERALVQDKIEALLGPRFTVTNSLVVRDRFVE